MDLSLQVSYEIYSDATNQLTFSKNNLVDDILNSTENLSSSELKFTSVVLLRNSELSGDYIGEIEAVINEKSEYPSGTRIEKIRIYE